MVRAHSDIGHLYILLSKIYLKKTELTNSVHSFTSCSSHHLFVGQYVQQMSVKHWGSDNHTACRQIYTGGQSGSGDQDPDEALTESTLQDVSLIKCQT